jgi:hypothetical protein
MTVNYLSAQSDNETTAEELSDGIWTINWPDQQQWPKCVFTSQAAMNDPSTHHISLDEPRIRGIVQSIPTWAEGQPVPRVVIPTIPVSVSGVWSLWRIRLINNAETEAQQQKASAFLPVFYTAEGKSFPTTAKRIWEALLSQDAEFLLSMQLNVAVEQTETIYKQTRAMAETAGQEQFEKLQFNHAQLLKVEDEKFHYALNARRRAIDRIGLPEVRAYRHRQLDDDLAHWQQEMQQRRNSLPELVPLMLLQIGAV